VQLVGQDTKEFNDGGMMVDLDRKLFTCHREGPYTEAEWQAILAHVVGKLEQFLEQPVAVSEIQYYADGFAGNIASPAPFAGLLKLSWFGRIGVVVIGHKEATDLSAWLFFRGFGKRMVAIDGKALLYLNYRAQSPGKYEWTAVWSKDEYEEFEHWT
jgi:hypothetical protein